MNRGIITSVLGITAYLTHSNIALSQVTPDTPVYDVLLQLGEVPSEHAISKPDIEAWIERGRELVLTGETTDFEGNPVPLQSEHFKCVDCHSVEKDGPHFGEVSFEDRLSYLMERDEILRIGSSFRGIVNRDTWYNEDYLEKYPEAVSAAHEDLREAVQFCSYECSKGRNLEEWELDAVMAYLWSLQLTLGDLDLGPGDWQTLESFLTQAPSSEGLEWLKTFYSQAEPATFSPVPEDLEAGFPYEGDFERGEFIYKNSCLFCHGQRPGAPAYDSMDLTPAHFQYMEALIPTDGSFYYYVREGTFSNREIYMPLFTEERLSGQAAEDLRTYIETMAAP